tara:strand:+ start:3854 stop:4474 length:621 start_codon:yes stop_codon:yes gene_type:complete
MVNLVNIQKFQSYLKKFPNIQLVVVSKNASPEDVRIVYEQTGWLHFAENRVDSLRTKVEKLNDIPICWHYIGALQSRKIQEVVRCCDYIQTVMRPKEIDKIAKFSNDFGRTVRIFIQTNLTGLDNRGGCHPDEIENLYHHAKASEIDLVGLMTMAQDRKIEVFDELNDIRNKLDKNLLCSMGMSSDYIEAQKSGSDMIRIGSLIFD